MKNPKVSVVIPAYNHEKYVGEAIQSVLDQTFQDLELIIINDGSTDNTETEILKFKDERIRYFSQENRGLSATLNRGIELARGEYFNFLPSDDAFYPEKFEIQLKSFEGDKGDTGLGLVFAYPQLVDAKGREITDDPAAQWAIVPYETKEEIFPALFERNFLSAPAALIKMDCLKKVGIFDESLKYAQDYDMWMRVLKYFDIRLLKQPLVKYRWHGGNLTWAPTLETERERAKLLLKAYLSLSIKEIFPSLLLLKEIDCPGDFAKAYRRLAGYLGKSGLEEMKLFPEICEETAKGVENLTPSGRGLFNKRGGRDLDQLSDPAKFIQGGKKINVLMETRSLDRGGLEEVIYNIARHLDRDLFNLVIVCTDRGGSVAERCRKIGIPVEILKDEKEREYREILLRYDIDLLVTHYSTFGVDITTKMNVPVVSFLHNIYCWVPDDVLGEMKRADQKIDRYIAVSEDVKNYSVYRFNISPEKIATVPNGIDLDRLEEKQNLSVPRRADVGLGNADYIFLNVASLTPAKAHLLILATLKEVIAEHPEVKVLCIGEILDQEYGEFVKAQIAAYGLERHIRLVEFVEEIHPYYKMADAFLLPSIIEGWSLSMMEAMAYGLPLILTKVGGAAQVVENNDIGLLVDNRYPDVFGIERSALDNYRNELPPNIPSLKRAMLQFLKEKAYWKEAGLKGKRKVVDQFDIRIIVNRYEALFHSVVALNAKTVKNKLSDQRDALLRERDFLLAEQDRLSAERDRLLVEQDRLSAERKQFLNVQEGLLAVKNKLSDQRDALLRERDFLLVEQDRLSAERDRLLVEQDRLSAERDRLLVEQDRLSAERKQFLNVQEGLLKEMSQRLQKREGEIDEIRHLIDSRYQQLDKRIEYVVMRLSIKERVKERLHKLLKAVHTLVPKKFREKYRSQYRRFFFDKVFPERERLVTASPRSPHSDHYRNSVKIPSGIDFFIFPIIDWELRYQRPQQIAERLANKGNRIFYFRTTFIEAPKRMLSPKDISSMVKIEEYKGDIYLITLVSHKTYNLYRDSLDDALSLKYLLDSLDVVKELFQIRHTVAIVDLPFWLPIVAQLPDNKIIYDCMDDHECFSTNTKKMVNHEKELLRRADLILASSELLFQKASKINKNTVMLKNAADIEHFSNLPESDVLKHINRPIIGYHGAISDWFDTQLVSECAKAYPQCSFVLIGSTFNADLGPFEDLKNVYLMGEIPYKEVPKYLKYFDVCMIPFKIIPLTQATDPVKFYEYLSAGKPVVTTALRELFQHKEICYFSNNEQEFVANIRRALDERDDAIRESRIRLARENSWDNRVEQILKLTKELFPKISIVLITFNNLEYTKSCVESIFTYSRYPNFQLILVDNHSQDGTIEYLKELQSRKLNVQFIFNEENKGFAGGNNLGLKVAEGEYIVLLNNDTVVTKDWLYVLMSILQKNPRLGMIGPVSNTVWNVQKIRSDYHTVDEMHKWAEYYTSQQQYDYRAVNMLGFFCLMIKREVIEKVGLLDENYGVGMFEDDDFCRRAREAGYELGYTKRVFIHHKGSASFGNLSSREYETIWEKNKAYFENKWGIKWSNDLVGFVNNKEIDEKAVLDWDEYHRFQLQKVLENNEGPVAIFAPLIDWNTPVFQRPPHIAEGLSKLGYLVFFCTENQKYDKVEGFLEMRPRLYLTNRFHLLREIGRKDLILFVYSTDNKMAYSELEEEINKGKKVVYEYIDEVHDAITGKVPPKIFRRHEAILKNERFFVVATADKLYQEVLKHRSRNCVLATNGVDYEHFNPTKNIGEDIPKEIKNIRDRDKPIIGYYGSLATWFDYELLIELAERRPNYEILLIGYNYDDSLGKYEFHKLSNVSIMDPVDYKILPRYAYWFDVGIIPFKINEITEAVSPIKLFEYMALGRPIVTTDMAECRKYRSVLIGKNHDDFIKKIDEALILRKDITYLDLLRKEAMENTWESKALSISKLLDNFK
ncbi:MAG: glycosyltransferase [Thermodesulfobacteriota bacterium]